MLYVIHALFDGLAFMIPHMLHITIGQTFSGGFIDFVLFGILLQGKLKPTGCSSRWCGIPWFFAYYFTASRYLIKRFDWLTPGRENRWLTRPACRKVSACGGDRRAGRKDNLDDVDCCATSARDGKT